MEKELTEEELENFIGGVPRKFGAEKAGESLKSMEDSTVLEPREKHELDELFEDELENVKAGEHIDNTGHIYR